MTARADQSASHKISDRARLSPAALTAGGVGNLLEWYDFGLYGYFAPVLARQFFPSDDPLPSLIGAYGSFAVGFAMRLLVLRSLEPSATASDGASCCCCR